MYNVMIVEDDPMARRLLEIMVTSDDSYHLAVSVESASVAEVYCMTEAIDLILMDVCTALHASGLDAAIKIISADSDYYHHQPSGMQFHRASSRGRSGQLLVQRSF